MHDVADLLGDVTVYMHVRLSHVVHIHVYMYMCVCIV